MSFGLTGSPGIHPAGAQGEDAPALPKQIREPLEEAMLPPCPNSEYTSLHLGRLGATPPLVAPYRPARAAPGGMG